MVKKVKLIKFWVGIVSTPKIFRPKKKTALIVLIANMNKVIDMKIQHRLNNFSHIKHMFSNLIIRGIS